MTDHPELVCAYLLDGKGKGTSLAWLDIENWTPDQGALWVHLDATFDNTEQWLREKSGLSPFIIDGLLAQETRPRCDGYEEGIMLVMRGVNLNPGAEADDMVSIRIWVEQHRVISLRIRRLMAVDDLQNQLKMGKGPLSTGHLVARLAAQLTDRMGPIIENVGDQVSDLEDQLIRSNDEAPLDLRDLRFKLINYRRVAISLRRYIAPQRDALNRMSLLDEDWIDSRVEGRLRETVDRVTRITEELDDIRERSSVLQDELINRISQRMERTMYVLTLVATVMLPLGFLTGLLGINVGGMPGSETKWAFWAVCGGLAVLTVIEIWLLKRFRWL